MCLHWGDCKESYEKQTFVPHRFHSSNGFSSERILWFSPTVPSMEHHNWFGNVSFVIDWNVLLDKMGPHLYMIDEIVFPNPCSRVLLSKEDNTRARGLREVRLDSTSSVLKHVNGIYYHNTHKAMLGRHQLHIGLEVDLDEARWLFQHSSMFANDHTAANYSTLDHHGYEVAMVTGEIRKYGDYSCYKYNTVRNTECPNRCSKEETELWLREDKMETRKIENAEKKVEGENKIKWDSLCPPVFRGTISD